MEKNTNKSFFNKIINNQDLSSSGHKIVANIKFRGLTENLKVISILSAKKGEGKSTVAVQTANALAQSGSTVLLLDADTHKKVLSNSFKDSTRFSLYDFINGDCRIEQAIIATQQSGLYFLSCSSSIGNTPTIFTEEHLLQAIDIFKNNFDYIIVDTPPVLPCVDGVLLGKISDCAIVVVRQYKTKIDELTQLSEQLKIAEVNVIGCVLNFANKQEYKYY